MKGIGNMFPIKQIINASNLGTSNNAAAISPPLNSKIGIIDIIKIDNSLPIGFVVKPPNKSIKKLTNDSVILSLTYLHNYIIYNTLGQIFFELNKLIMVMDLDNFVLELIGNFGYIGMFIGMILEAVIIIIPSELILATGGILASQGVFSFWISFLIGLLGSVFCAIIIYAMGYWGGKPFVDKYGNYFFMKKEDLDKTDSWFNKYGLIACCVGRNIPIIRTLISLPIGITRMSFKKFLIYTIIGSIPWTFIFVYVGYALGNNWTILSSIMGRIKTPIKFILIIYILYWIVSKIIQKKRAS